MPHRKPVREQALCRAALANRAVTPERRERQRRLGAQAVEKCRNRREACADIRQSRFGGREVANHQRDDAEDRFTGPECRITECRMLPDEIGQPEIDISANELRVERGRIVAEHRARRRLVRQSELSAQAFQRLDVGARALERPVWQPIVVVVHTGERGRDRIRGVVVREKLRDRRRARFAHGFAHACASRGIDTQRRCRTDCSTALMSSCTCAPSSKLPSLYGSSLRISVMNELTRFA